MTRESNRRITIVLACLGLALLAMSARSAETAPIKALPAHYWISDFAASPRIPLVGDVDGDGRADLLALSTQGEGILDLARTSALGKPRYPVQARTSFGKDALACAYVPTHPGKGGSVVALFKDGSIRLAHVLNSEGKYEKDDLVATLPAGLSLKAPIHAVAGAFHGEAVAFVDANGLVLMLPCDFAPGAAAKLTPLNFRIPGVRQLAAGSLPKASGDSLVWMDRSGNVYRGQVRFDLPGETPALEKQLLLHAASDEKLAVGRFFGAETADVLVGRKLLPEGDPKRAMTLPGLPTPAEAKGDLAWFAGDFDGDGKDDLLRVRRSGARFVGDDILLHLTRRADDTDSGFVSSSDDGLLDVWKTGKVKPGGLDLAALGCKVGHYDVIVELTRIENVPEDLLHREMERVVRYYASLPVTNPDGTHGIALHPIYLPTASLQDGAMPWWDLGAKYHAATHRGITHWMGVYNAGGGQSGQMDDRGSCGSHALYATFLHEFGHQLGLDHTGFWGPSGCPIYPSLMNYAYSYQLNGDPNAIGYSDGRLAGLKFDERRLSERLPLPMEKVAFLAGPPYHFRLKPSEDGKSTLIDWNWNGVFGEENIAADINYGYSTTGGLRHTIGKTYIAPVLTTFGSGRQTHLLLLGGHLSPGAPLPEASAAAPKPSLAPDQPGSLYVRLWQGERPDADGPKWGPERDLESGGVLGDASAATLAGTAWVAYPTAAGVTLRSITPDAKGTPQIGAAETIPDTQGLQPTLAAFAGRLALLLWQNETTPVRLRFLIPEGEKLRVGPEQALGFTSKAPVGAVEGGIEEGKPSLWIGLSQDQDEKRPRRWQIRRFTLEREGALRQASQEWVGGEAGSQRGANRPLLLWEPNRAFGPQGQLYVLSNGMFGKESPWACHYISMRVADKTIGGGWLERRYYDEWTQSRSAPAACFFRGEMIFAARWFGNVHGTENDNLFVAFHGRGIESEPMGDFDDIGFIHTIGLSHSIPCVDQQ